MVALAYVLVHRIPEQIADHEQVLKSQTRQYEIIAGSEGMAPEDQGGNHTIYNDEAFRGWLEIHHLIR